MKTTISPLPQLWKPQRSEVRCHKIALLDIGYLLLGEMLYKMKAVMKGKMFDMTVNRWKNNKKVIINEKKHSEKHFYWQIDKRRTSRTVTVEWQDKK